MNVHLVIPDLFWPGRGTRHVAADRLDALERLFAKGRRTRSEASSLTTWLLERWHAAGGAAAYAFLADGGDPGDANWLRADPCHLRVSRDEVLLLDAATFDISRAEAEAFIEELNRHFADRGMVFYPMQPERWYLRTAAALDIDSAPLALARGKPIELRPAEGARAHWHALANEIQMLLHGHPVNEAREQRGDPPVNAVWLSDSGRFVAPEANPFRRVRTEEPISAGLARAAGAAAMPLPESAERWLRGAAREGLELVVLDSLSAPASYGDAATWRERLAALERDWFAPLLDALRSGRIGMVTLHAVGAEGTLGVETTRQDLRYFWRRSKPITAYAH